MQLPFMLQTHVHSNTTIHICKLKNFCNTLCTVFRVGELRRHFRAVVEENVLLMEELVKVKEEIKQLLQQSVKDGRSQLSMLQAFKIGK